MRKKSVLKFVHVNSLNKTKFSSRKNRSKYPIYKQLSVYMYMNSLTNKYLFFE